LLVTGLAAIFYNKHPSIKSLNTPSQIVADDVEPGDNEALLTLADGTKISLSAAATGAVAKQAGIEIVKTKDGQLIYNLNKTSGTTDESGANEYNIISTPKGGQHQINLQDGTRIWLNAASSLKFLPDFADLKERRVELIGEAYFEVSKDKKRPFRVVTLQNGTTQIVEVLGTHFNINNYEDENSTKTTLVEGSVRILTDANQPKVLKPGQQSILKNNAIVIETVDTEDAIAWKNGNFIFNDENLESIMRKISRWYDVEVYYQDKLPQASFLGTFSRSKNLSTLLKSLESAGKVHFKIEGRRITVMK
jgi:transmembrane sensor